MVSMATDGNVFKVEVAETPDGPVVKAVGDLDLLTIETLVSTARGQLQDRSLPDPPPILTIDLAGVNFCDSAGINGLVSLKNACGAVGWRFRVVNLRDHIRHVIVDLTGLGEFLDVGPATPVD